MRIIGLLLLSLFAGCATQPKNVTFLPPLPPSPQTRAVPATVPVPLAWNASQSASVTNYRLWYGTGTATNLLGVGNQLTATVAIPREVPYWFFVTARDSAGRESVPSNTLLLTLPALPPDPPVNLRFLLTTQAAVNVNGAWTNVHATILTNPPGNLTLLRVLLERLE